MLISASVFWLGCKKEDGYRPIVPVTIKGGTKDGHYSFTVTDQTGKQLLAKNNITNEQEYVLENVRDGDVLTVQFTFHRMCNLIVKSYGRARSTYFYSIDGDISDSMTYAASTEHEYIY